MSRSFLQAESLQPSAKVRFELLGIDLVRMASQKALEGAFFDPALVYVKPAHPDPLPHFAGGNTKGLRQFALSESFV